MSTVDAFTEAEYKRSHRWSVHAFSFDVLYDRLAAAKQEISGFVRRAHEGQPRLVRVNCDRYTGLGWRTFIDYDNLTVSVMLPHGHVRQYSARDVVVAEPGTVVPTELRRAILRRSSISALDGRPRGTLP